MGYFFVKKRSPNMSNTITAAPFVIIANEKGGVRKTATAIVIHDLITRAGIRVAPYQIDQQGRLEQLLPDVISINLPKMAELAIDELADAMALRPLEEALGSNPDVAVLVDVGANLDGRLAVAAAEGDWHGWAIELGRPIYIVIPFLLDPDSVTLASRTLARLEIAFPGAIKVPVASISSSRFVGFDSIVAEQTFKRGFGVDACEENICVHPLILPATNRMLSISNMTPTIFAQADWRELEKLTTRPRGEIKTAQAHVFEYLDVFQKSLSLFLPFCHE
jgi:CobQ/CobB/MinD/ParA nucleotide binding domain